MKLIAVGDNVVDYYQDQETFYPGGNALNVAVLAKRLGHESSYIGIVGNDEAAAHLLNVLKLAFAFFDFFNIDFRTVYRLDSSFFNRFRVFYRKKNIQSILVKSFYAKALFE